MPTNKTVALIGNPNSGKSSLFNKLTGLRQKTGNFPGITVEKKAGTFDVNDSSIRLIDFPGTYSLHPTSNDERVVLNILANKADKDYPDAIIYVADITNLERHTLLLTQILDLGIPVLLALNMVDLLGKEWATIYDVQKLQSEFGIPVQAISGRTGENIGLLKNKLVPLKSVPQEK